MYCLKINLIKSKNRHQNKFIFAFLNNKTKKIVFHVNIRRLPFKREIIGIHFWFLIKVWKITLFLQESTDPQHSILL